MHSQLMDNQQMEIPLREKCGNWKIDPKPETPVPQRLTYHGRFYQKINTREITCITVKMPNLPQSHMPVRSIHRRREIHVPHVMARKAQSHEPPIQISSPTKYLSKGLEKLAISFSVHLQPSKVCSLTVSPTYGSPATLSHHDRADLLVISGQGPSPHPKMVVSLPPTNTLPSNIKSPTIHIHRRWTRPRSPRR